LTAQIDDEESEEKVIDEALSELVAYVAVRVSPEKYLAVFESG
jgi:hypothetical protein